jgi:hypothetical protein
LFQRVSPVCVISTKLQFIMELESDTYDVVVISTGLAESIAAAQVILWPVNSNTDDVDPSRNLASRSSTWTRTNTMVGNKLLSPSMNSRHGVKLARALRKTLDHPCRHHTPKARRMDTPTPRLPNWTTPSLPIDDDTPYPSFHPSYPPEVH